VEILSGEFLAGLGGNLSIFADISFCLFWSGTDVKGLKTGIDVYQQGMQ
jgi:hypothetical protein